VRAPVRTAASRDRATGGSRAIPVFTAPDAPAVTGDGRRLYLANRGSSTVSVVRPDGPPPGG
jgi:DNA-binding beta-propeller fold protein YncE